MKKKTKQAKSAQFLLDASWLYKDTCPELSRFLMQDTRKSNAESSVCPYCYQWLLPDNHRMRLRPKQRPSSRVQRVLRRKARGKRLGLVQQNLLHRFQKSSSVLMATCHTCSKTSRRKGMNRDFIATLAKTHGTPGSTAMHRTPQSSHRANTSTPTNPGRDKTPAHTPRSSTSFNTSGSGSSSSKTPSKAKNWLIQGLGKILMREDRHGSKKVGLKDFLSSL
ncbi:UPF0711 protein C18orf21 homolog [Spinachia spinachia]